MGTNYTYTKHTVGAIAIGIIETAPSNIKLINLNRETNLWDSAFYGINGGFFKADEVDARQMYNIAVNDGIVIHNGNSVGRGVISYKGGSTLSYETAQYNTEITGISTTGTWAQGGALMSLGSTNWGTKLGTGFPNQPSTVSVGWSALVVDRTQTKVLLIVTINTCALSLFRSAIQSYLGITDGTSDSTRYKGIFLDGGLSSQLKAKGNTEFMTQNRKLMQIIALKNPN